MKASKEVAIDAVILRMLGRKDVKNKNDLLKIVSEEHGYESREEVDHFIGEGKSEAWNDYVEEIECSEHVVSMFFDESTSDFYCPICEQK